MVRTERPRPVTLFDIVGSGRVKILDGLKLDERDYLQRLLEARNGLKEGNQSAWEQFSRDNSTRAMAKRLREKVAGRKVMELIYGAFPIPDSGNPLTDSALVVHGEVDVGELNNQEGILR